MQLELDRSQTGLLRQPTPEEAAAANARRRHLLDRIEAHITHGFAGSKPHTGPLSPGCQSCGGGRWSCLFINSFCNATCFFCPGLADKKSVPPYAERIVFERARDYAAYVERLGFGGVSFSGGEPFLTVDRVLAYLTAVRRRVGDGLYVWLYTNGRVATDDKLRAVVEAGLNEVRVDLAAFDYTELDAVRRAVAHAPRVTVEVPAVPEDQAKLHAVLPELVDIGVKHLNLHQLMMFGNNGPDFVDRRYTLVGDSAPCVVESELSALETIQFVLDEGLDIAVNYCAQSYKNRFQSHIEDKRAAPLVMRPQETMTASGLVRRLTMGIDAAAASRIGSRLAALDLDDAVNYDAEQGLLYVHPEVIGRLPESTACDERVRITYLKTVVGERADSDWARRQADYHEVAITPRLTIGVRMFPVSPPIALSRAEALELAAGGAPTRVAVYENVAVGLPDYLPA